MYDTQLLKEKIDLILQQTTSVLDLLLEKNDQFSGVEILEDVKKSWHHIIKNNYLVLVAGEAKRGKSSFINALIGQKLLPVEVAIATSKVFYVHQSSSPQYCLTYENGKKIPITQAELDEYGSQTVADQNKILKHSLQGLHWIEVGTPSLYIPEGITLLDTPGLGSLYPMHSQVTRSFVPLADAVIFVLEANETISPLEIDFLKTILETTSHIFFVYTKTDSRLEDEILQMQKRHEAVLNKYFGKQLPSIHVWPFSSKLLMNATQKRKAAQQGKQQQMQIDLLIEESHIQETMQGLTSFLFKSSGVNRCNEALLLALNYHAQTEQLLQQRLERLKDASSGKIISHQQVLQQKQRFVDEYGVNGEKRQKLLQNLKKIATKSKKDLMALFLPGGGLEQEFLKEIKDLKTVSEVNKYGERLQEQVANRVTIKLQVIAEEARKESTLLVQSLLSLTPQSLIFELSNPHVSIDAFERVRINQFERFKHVQEGFEQGTLVGGALVVVVLSHIVLPVAIPITLIGIGIAGTWGAVRFWQDTEATQVQESLQTLRDYLRQIVQHTYHEISRPHELYEGENFVDYRLGVFERTIIEKVDDILNKKLQEAEKESARLQIQLALDEQQRQNAQQDLRKQLNEWTTLGLQLENTMQQLQDLNL